MVLLIGSLEIVLYGCVIREAVGAGVNWGAMWGQGQGMQGRAVS